jgi:hypothetical protein
MTESLAPDIQKLKTFFDTFHMLAADNIDVDQNILIKKLVKTDLFTTNEAKEYIVKGLKFGQICENILHV